LKPSKPPWPGTMKAMINEDTAKTVRRLLDARKGKVYSAQQIICMCATDPGDPAKVLLASFRNLLGVRREGFGGR
jgi:hypothetical protein